MWNLISLKEKSKIKMMEEFYKTNEPITISKLSELTNTSSRSIKNYLEELKKTVDGIGGKFVSTSAGVNFEIPVNIGLDYFQKQVFKKSLGFIMLEKIFFDETLTSVELENDLYISASTLSRITNTIKEALQAYGLTLETSPFRLIGKEQLIREFYTQYFVEAYSANEWPFKPLDKDIVDEILSSSTEDYYSTSEFMDYSSFRFRFAVGCIRGLNGHSINNQLQKNDRMTVILDEIVPKIKERINHLSFNSSNVKNTYINELVSTQLFISKQALDDRMQHDEDFKNQLSKIKQMIDLLTEQFGLPEENRSNLITEIHNGISFFVHNSNDVQPKRYLLYPPRDYHLIELYQRRYSRFYNSTNKILRLLCEDRGLIPTKETLEYLNYLLISNWNDLTKNLFGHYNATSIKVHSHLSLRHAHGIAESLISDLPAAVKVGVFEEPIMNEEVVSKYDFDILISTETLTLDIDQPIVYMYKSRSNYQYEYLQMKIKEIARQKEKDAKEKFMDKENFSTAIDKIIELPQQPPH